MLFRYPRYALLGLVLMTIGGTAVATTLSISAPGQVTVGDSFFADVLIDQAVDLAGFEFHLRYDDALAAALSVSSAGLFGADTFPVQAEVGGSSVSFAEVSLALSGVDVAAPAPLARVELLANSPGDLSISFDQAVLADSFGIDIALDGLLDAHVGIVPVAPAALPSSLILLLPMLATLVLARRRLGHIPRIGCFLAMARPLSG